MLSKHGLPIVLWLASLLLLVGCLNTTHQPPSPPDPAHLLISAAAPTLAHLSTPTPAVYGEAVGSDFLYLIGFAALLVVFVGGALVLRLTDRVWR